MTTGTDGPGAVALGTADAARAIAAIKAALRIDGVSEDALIGQLADTAFGMAEHFLGQALIARAVQCILPVASGWQRLPVAPVRSIGAVAGLASDGGLTALPVIGYAIDIDARGDGWVRVSDGGGAMRVAVTAQAGVADDWDALPPPVRQGIVLLASYLFSERDTTRPPPTAITALWRPFRGMMLAAAVHP